jgi:acetoacetate decarboxylase
MPHSTGFDSYTGSAQAIPVRFAGEMGNYTHAMFLVREVISCVHLIADLTLDLGQVVHDYLA